MKLVKCLAAFGLAALIALPVFAGQGQQVVIGQACHGSLSFERDLTWCPLDLEDPLMYIALFLHWDHALYGSQFGTFLVGQLPGLVGSDHLCFATGDSLVP